MALSDSTSSLIDSILNAGSTLGAAAIISGNQPKPITYGSGLNGVLSVPGYAQPLRNTPYLGTAPSSAGNILMYGVLLLVAVLGIFAFKKL